MEEILKKQTQQSWLELLQKYPGAKDKANDPQELGELVDMLYDMDQEIWKYLPLDQQPTKEIYTKWLKEVLQILG